MKHTSEKPCPHMKNLLSTLVDSSLTGVARWYSENHARRCPGCSSALSSLSMVRERVRALGVPSSEALQLSQERWDSIEAAWVEVDQAET